MATAVESRPTLGEEIQRQHASMKIQINNFRDTDNGILESLLRLVQDLRTASMPISLTVQLYSTTLAGKKRGHYVSYTIYTEVGAK